MVTTITKRFAPGKLPLMKYCRSPRPQATFLGFAEIERVGRHSDGQLRGFQRHQIASHIREIRDYLARDDALLPNPIVIAFIDGITITPLDHAFVHVEIEVGNTKPGYIVDGQQRLTALSGITKPDFQVYSIGLIVPRLQRTSAAIRAHQQYTPAAQSAHLRVTAYCDGITRTFHNASVCSAIGGPAQLSPRVVAA